MHNYNNLIVWERAVSFSGKIYSATKCFPKEEIFGLTSQIRRASISVPSNIAEGSSRSSNKEFKRFVEFALGSAFEMETQLLISRELDYLSGKDFDDLNGDLVVLIKQLSQFRARLAG